MENRDLERTEELMKQGGSKKKTPLIIAVVIAALLIAGIGGFAAVKANKNKEVAKNLDQAEKYLAEGEYEQAVAAYSAAIDIDDKNVPAFRGRARAQAGQGKNEEAFSDIDRAIELDPGDKDSYQVGIEIGMKTGDMGRVDKYIEDMHNNVEGTEDITKGSLLLGSDPSEMANQGLMLTDGDTVYTAGRDSIKVSEGGKDKDPIVSGLKVDGKDAFITGLSKKDGYIYFVANVSLDGLVNHDAGLCYGKSIYRVKADGSGEPEQIFDYNWDPKEYYPDLPMFTFAAGDYPYYMSSSIAVIGDRIYFNEYTRNWDTPSPFRLYSVGLDGKGKKDAGVYTKGTITSDGENIYYVEDSTKIMKYSVADGKAKTLCEPGDDASMTFIGNSNGQLVYSGGKIYYVSSSPKGTAICSADAGSGKTATLYDGDMDDGGMQGENHYGADGAMIPTTVISVSDGKLYFTSKATSGLPDGGKFEVTISSLDLKDGAQPEEFKTIEHDFADDGLQMGGMYAVLSVEGFSVDGDSVHCMLSAMNAMGNNAYYAYAFEN